jgi:thiol-disulfide isomerase/thioredoxin
MTLRFAFIVGVLALLVGFGTVAAQETDFEGTVPAPDFPPGVEWLNVPAPLTLDDLRGKIVVLDFWTYGCINCIHMIPVLEQLEAKYAEELVVVGVHSAKFTNEGRTDNLRQIIQRYEIHHPVINDNAFNVWQTYGRYGVRAWPTFVVIDPMGKIVAVQPGEIPFDVFDRVIGGMVNFWDERGAIDRTPIELTPATDTRPNSALAFPGKVLADPATNRLFIADSTHNRIVIADLLTYEVLDVIGSGAEGLTDGAFGEATFNKPQGMALVGNVLYIADTKNHVIRAADLGARTVETAVGTGEQARRRDLSGPARETPIASPWDLALGADDTLYIAMAGPHQIWALDLANGVVYPLVGSGREGLADGAFPAAQLAQPSGLFFRDGLLYFADSESSSIRVADTNSGEVRTLAGPLENDLFTYGDVDGPVGESRLQHALGITGGPDGALYIADTYNNKIKLIDPESRTTTTLFGTDNTTGGFRDGGPDTAAFDEPGGLTFVDGRLYVADTNNHAVRVIDLAVETVNTITFPNPEALQIGERPTIVAGNAAEGRQVTLPEQTVSAGDGMIALDVVLPEGYKLNDLAPFTAAWSAAGDAVSIDPANATQSILEPAMPVTVPVTLAEGAATLHGDLTIYYCEAVDETLCFIDRVRVEVPVTVASAADEATIAIEHTVTPPPLPGS